MRIIVETDTEYGCKYCPLNELYTKDRQPARRCKLTGTPMTIDHIHAMIRGATLIDCPKEHYMSYDDVVNYIVRRYT